MDTDPHKSVSFFSTQRDNISCEITIIYISLRDKNLIDDHYDILQFGLYCGGAS